MPNEPLSFADALQTFLPEDWLQVWPSEPRRSEAEVKRLSKEHERTRQALDRKKARLQEKFKDSGQLSNEAVTKLNEEWEQVLSEERAMTISGKVGRIAPLWPKFLKLLRDDKVSATGIWDGNTPRPIPRAVWDYLEPAAQWLWKPDDARHFERYDHPTSRAAFFPEVKPRELGAPIHDADTESVFRNKHTGDLVLGVRFRWTGPRGSNPASHTTERRCRELIRERVKAGRQPKTKDVFFEEALSVVPGLERAVFDRIWKKEVPATWKAGGRKPPQRTSADTD